MPADTTEADAFAAAALKTDRIWPVVVKLSQPVEFGQQTITELSFKRGKLGDLKGMKVDATPSADQLMLIASRLCGQPAKVIESLDTEDSGEVIELALSFFARCLVGGKTQ